MGLERDRDRLRLLLARTLGDVLENSFVGAMHAVEVADAHDRRAKVGWNIFEFVEDLHAKSGNRKVR
jgi:hypothetical protein